MSKIDLDVMDRFEAAIAKAEIDVTKDASMVTSANEQSDLCNYTVLISLSDAIVIYAALARKMTDAAL